ncbi:PepSY-associated TM helix domain-containing protein [Colwellia sp. Bg11-28]|uniref:PepSY-associated TM helix domain-containing protein n=1 Tax=Colwellia sp. Bg11-28 TaxID=2058305 RepID=UPI000C32E33C|nr:PepSY-associated TM helix domain-containing protein [Colwellia sp. Bg11-28]PKH87687.1 hypothetical protein CXF79_13700 [Colwellia sp. Bg11-28]
MRKKLYKWHSVGALFAMLPLLIISLTGSILVFKVELDTLLMPDKMQVSNTSPSERLSLDVLMANVKSKYPAHEIGSWELFDDKSRTDTAYLIKQQTTNWSKLYVNQYSGELLSKPIGTSDDLTDWLLDLHYKLLLETNGMFLGAVVSLLLLFLGISGIILYRKFWINFFTLRLILARRIFFSDLHKMIGISSSPVILILAFTGAYWNISLVIHEVSEHIVEEPYLIEHQLHNQELSIQTLLNSNQETIKNFEATYLLMPFEPAMDIMFYGTVNSANPLNSNYSSTISYDKSSGEMIHSEDVRSANALHVTIDSFRKLHFGHFGGLTSKLIWCVLGLSPLILAFTGLYLYLYKNRNRKILSVSRIKKPVKQLS